MKFSPITGIFGHRQVGKTTLAELLGKKYVTLDVSTELSDAQVGPELFLAKNVAHPLVIDECQNAPNLFPALKEWVRIRKTPGQFLITGSVRFSSRKAIRESLTGRIITWDLLPMDWSEQNQLPLPNTILKLINEIYAPIDSHKKTVLTYDRFLNFVETGGLPGIFAVRDNSIRKQRFETQINTLLERDLRLVVQTSLGYSSLRKFLVALAVQAGHPLEYGELARTSRISLPSIRKLVAAMESLFVIRLVPCEGDYSKPIVFFEDIGELNYLRRFDQDNLKTLKAFLYHNLRTQIHYRPECEVDIFSYKTRRGFDIPICFRRHSKILGVLPANKQTFQDSFETAKRFTQTNKNASVVLVSLEKPSDERLTDKIRWISASSMI